MNSPSAVGFCCGVQVKCNKENFSRAAILSRRTHPTCIILFFPLNDIHAKHPSLIVYLKKKNTFIRRAFLHPFYSSASIPYTHPLTPLYPQQLSSTVDQVQMCNTFIDFFPSIWAGKSRKPENNERAKPHSISRQYQHLDCPDGTSTSSSGSDFHPMAYQGQKGSFVMTRQNFDRGTSSHDTTSSTSFQPMAYRLLLLFRPATTIIGVPVLAAPAFNLSPINNNSGNNHNKNNMPILTTSITNTNQHHGAAAGRTTSL